MRARVPIIDVWNKADVLEDWEGEKGKDFFQTGTTWDPTAGVRKLERLQNQYFMSGRGAEAIGFTVPELDDAVLAKKLAADCVGGNTVMKIMNEL